MTAPATRPVPGALSRRRFLQASSGTAAAITLGAGATAAAIARTAHAGGSDTLRVGVIGCGGRGTGAALNALEADPATRVVALADLFRDRVDQSLANLKADEQFGERVSVDPGARFDGFDAYKALLDSPVDIVILATAPGFRPTHLEAAVAAGRHVFMEKPAGVDPAGIRRVLAAGAAAEARGLAIVAGTQRRHDPKYRALLERVHRGDVGRIVSGACWWNQGGLWMQPRRPEHSDMEWQIRNWLYFTWLSGDHIVEQHVHNIDVMNWAIGAHPLRALGMGGRQSRTAPEYGHIFDHFAVEFEYPGGVLVTSMCRQADNCAARVDELLLGTEGRVLFGAGAIEGARPYTHESAPVNPYVEEHRALIASIRDGRPRNEARAVAESTLTAVMGRMSAYTGREVTWDEAMASTLDLSPAACRFGPLPPAEVAIPGRTGAPLAGGKA